MDFRTTSIEAASRRGVAGFTLAENLVAVAIVSLCLAALGSVTVYCSYSLQSAFNYADLNQADRVATDTLTREIREANGVTAFTTNSLTLQDSDGLPLVYAYDPATQLFTRTKNGATTVLLKQCGGLSFDLGERNAIDGSYDVFPAASVSTAKVIDISWRCARKIKGVNQNTEAVQTARIVIRKQGT